MKSSLLLLLLASLLVLSNGSTVGLQPKTKLYQSTFQLVWERVRDRFYDPSLGGVDWKAVHNSYAPKVKLAKSEDELYSILNRMLGEMKQSHFALIPPSYYRGEEAALAKRKPASGSSPKPTPKPTKPDERFGRAETGLTIQLIEGKAVVTRVEMNSPGAHAGIRPGCVVSSVDGVSLAKVANALAKRKERDSMHRFRFYQAVAELTTGRLGDSVTLKYMDRSDRSRSATLRLVTPKGEPVKFGELPVIYSRVESRRLSNELGYVRFNIFLLPLLPKIQSAIADMSDCRTLILDLRGNPGGIGLMAIPVATPFYAAETSLGVTKLRDGEIKYLVKPSAKPFRGRVLILTDETTASTAEILAGGMQETDRATVVGAPSVGAVLPSVIEKLPIGARLQYAFADFKTPKGVLLEGRGVRPNVPVKLTRRALIADPDPVLTAAVRYARGAEVRPMRR